MTATRQYRIRAGLRLAFAAVPGAVLAYAAAGKIAAPQDFALALFRYDLLPACAINLAAVFVPWLELVTGLALIAVPALRRGAAVVGAGLLGVFAAAVAANLLRGVEAACGCFSLDPAAPPAGWGHVALNLALMAACAAAAWGTEREGVEQEGVVE